MQRLSSKLGLSGKNTIFFMCPGCGTPVAICAVTQDQAHKKTNPGWIWNGDVEKPTFSPSIKSTHGSESLFVCHSFIRDGKIEFLNDCTHEFKGQTVDLPDLPDWVFEKFDDGDL